MKHTVKLFCLLTLSMLLVLMASCASEPTAAAPEMRVSDGNIQWKSDSASEWQTLISVSELEGESGDAASGGSAGTNSSDENGGREIEIQNNGTYIQWRYKGDTVWTNIVALSDITGPAGAAGADGTNGAAGSDGSDGTNGTAGIAGVNGADGREVEIQNNGTYVQWRYDGDTTWHNLVALSDITGVTGATGAAGAMGATGAVGPAGMTGPAGATGAIGATGIAGSDGREVEFQNSGTYIQWRYVGDTTWTNLVALTDITGPTGAMGATGAAGPVGATGATGAAGADGADGTALAYAQYSFTGFSDAGTHMKMANETTSSDASLISLADAQNITLGAGHTFYVSCNLTAFNDSTTFSFFLEPFFNTSPRGYQWSEAALISTFGQYYLSISHSFLIVSGGGGTMSFSCLTSGGTPTIDDIGSLVTVLCIK